MARKRKKSMMDVAKTGIMYGVGTSVIAGVTPAGNVRNIAQAGLTVKAAKDLFE